MKKPSITYPNPRGMADHLMDMQAKGHFQKGKKKKPAMPMQKGLKHGSH